MIAQEALTRWREAERRRERSAPESPDREAADREADQAKADYEDAVDAAMREQLPVPVAFDEAIRDAAKTDMSAVGDDGQVFGG